MARDFFDSHPAIPIPETALRGPADADHYRTFHGKSRNRWYVDPLPADDRWSHDSEENVYPAISTVKKASGNDWTLVGFKRAAEQIAKNPGRFEGMNYDEIYATLRQDNDSGLGRASKRGTNVHHYFEAGLRGQEITFMESPREPGATYLPAVRAFFQSHKPELVAAEVVCIHRDLNRESGLDNPGYGGTGDALMTITCHKESRLWVERKEQIEDNIAWYERAVDALEKQDVAHRPAGRKYPVIDSQEDSAGRASARDQLITKLSTERETLRQHEGSPTRHRLAVAGDWKSRADEGEHKIYPEEAAQVGALAGAQYMIIESPVGPARVEIPALELGIIVSVRPDSFRIYPVHLDKAFTHFGRMHAWWQARQDERKIYGRVWPPSKVMSLRDQLEVVTSRDEAVQLWKMNKSLWTDELTLLMKERWPE